MALQVKFGVTTWLWTSPFTTKSIHQLFPKIAEMGFDAVEIAVEDPGDIDANAVKNGLKEYGLQPVVCAAFGPSRDLTNDDPAIHENCFAYIRSCFDLCNAWGTTFLAGPMYSAVGKARMVPPEQRKKNGNWR